MQCLEVDTTTCIIICVFQLTSCGVYQRGEEDEGVFGFLVDDIKQEIRRSARLVRGYFLS